VTIPLDRLSPRSILGELRSASWDGPVGWPVLLIPAPWLLTNQVFYAVGNGLSAGPAFGLAALALSAHLVVLATLLWAVVPWLKRLLKLRSVMGLQLVFFCVGGVARATVMVLGTVSADSFLSRWVLLSVSWALNTGIWTAAAAILVGWWDQVREQRMELEVEYERQVLTRGHDARALAQADLQLAAVRESTHAALADIGAQLDEDMSAADLSQCIEGIDNVVAGLVRPISHDLARMAVDAEPIHSEVLWRGWREVVPAVIRSWPSARPFQPALVGLLCLPMVMVAELVPAPHRFDRGSVFSMAILVTHLLLLVLADRLLAPKTARIAPRGGVSVVVAVYLTLYLVGLTALILASKVGSPAPLEAFLVPPLLASISGGISAFSKIRREESAAARALIRRTNWEVRRTRQRLWAQRRRLAMALHGRVQANLTAASLMLGMARDRMDAGQGLDHAVVERVRSTVALADLIDQSSADSPATRLDTVTQVWEGVLSVDLDLRPGALLLLEDARDLTDACVEVVREILLNAVRHSGATRVEIVIGADHESLLCIRITEMSAAREPMGSIGGPGLGRSLIDSLAVDWAESDREQGRVTVALLAAGSANTALTDARSRLGDVSMLT
jgi:signal transduction histidine kinase